MGKFMKKLMYEVKYGFIEGVSSGVKGGSFMFIVGLVLLFLLYVAGIIFGL